MKKFFKKNSGFAGIDISISMIIILIFIPTIFGIVYNIQKINSDVKRKSTAVNIATNVLEIVKSEAYSDITTSGNKLNTDIKKKYEASTYKNTDKEETGYSYVYYKTIGENGEHYQIQLGIKNYYPSDTDRQDYVKQVKVRVFYPYGDSVKDIDISIAKTNT